MSSVNSRFLKKNADTDFWLDGEKRARRRKIRRRRLIYIRERHCGGARRYSLARITFFFHEYLLAAYTIFSSEFHGGFVLSCPFTCNFRGPQERLLFFDVSNENRNKKDEK